MDYKQLSEVLAATLNPQLRHSAESRLHEVRDSRVTVGWDPLW